MGGTIVVLSSNRAEGHLLEPLVDELKKRNKFDVMFWRIDIFTITVDDLVNRLKSLNPIIVIVPCDREEMFRITVELFYNHIPMAHFHAGDLSKEGSFDDITRHMITLMCDVHFCNGMEAKKRVQTLLRTIGKPTTHVYNVGTTTFDKMKIDYSEVPNEPFDLVLYNVPTRKPEEMEHDLDLIESMLNKQTIWIYPNVDPGYERVIQRIEQVKKRNTQVTSYVKLSHPKFLGLVEKCDRFIGNSSSMFLEAPFLKSRKKIIHIGSRNLGRETPRLKKGASKKIVSILEKLYL